jgi:hypothetical protein
MQKSLLALDAQRGAVSCCSFVHQSGLMNYQTCAYFVSRTYFGFEILNKL